MVLKIIGCSFILISSCILGIYYSMKTEYRIADLLTIKKSFSLLLSEIEFNLSPLSEAMKNISLKVNKPFRNIFYEFADRLGKEDKSAEQLWSDCLTKYSKNTYFEKSDIDNLMILGQTIGYLDIKQQRDSIKFAVDYIENTIDEIKEKSQKNKKLYKSLGFFGGMVITVILF